MYAWLAAVHDPGAEDDGVRSGKDARPRPTKPFAGCSRRCCSSTPARTSSPRSSEIYANSDKSRTELVIPDWVAKHGHSHTENKAGYTAAVDQFLARYDLTFGGARK